MTVLRSLLFVPGNQPRMLEQASALKPDAFIPDMEDSVRLLFAAGVILVRSLTYGSFTYIT